MALPNPSMSFSPFAILTAEELNDLVENIESIYNGNLADGSISGSKLNYPSMIKDFSTTGFTRSANIQAATTTVITLVGNVLSVYVGFTPAVAFADAAITIGQLNLSAMGIAQLSYQTPIGQSDGANSFFMATCSATGVLESVDARPTGIAVGDYTRLSFVTVVTQWL